MNLSKAKILVATLVSVSGLLGVIPATGATIDPHIDKHSNNSVIDNQTNCYIDIEKSIGSMIKISKYCLDLIYVISIVVITVLYILIYKEIYTRRKKKRDRRHELLMTTLRNGGDIGTMPTYKAKKELLNGAELKPDDKNEKELHELLPAIEDKFPRRNIRPSLTNNVFISKKDVRTAFMLFVITFLYILLFSPSMIATYISLLKSDEGQGEETGSSYYTICFYLYYFNSAINPMIYCFLNPTFRKDLRKIFFSRDSFYNRCINWIH